MLAGNAFKQGKQVLVCADRFPLCRIPCVLSLLPGSSPTAVHPCPALQQNLHHQVHQLAPHSLGRKKPQSPKMTWIFQQIRKSTNKENQVINYESGPNQQPLLLTIPINYSWFRSQSWAQLSELTYTLNVNVRWPNLPIPWSFLTAKERLSKWQLSLCTTCSSARGRWGKWWRERCGTELEGWVTCLVSYPRDAALLLRSTMKYIPGNSLKTLQEEVGGSGRLPDSSLEEQSGCSGFQLPYIFVARTGSVFRKHLLSQK